MIRFAKIVVARILKLLKIEELIDFLEYMVYSKVLEKWIKQEILHKTTIKSKQVCLFAHFNKNDKVSSYVFYYLNALKEIGFEIVFITGSSVALVQDLEELKKYCPVIIKKQNVGMDFYSWKIGWQFIQEVQIPEQLLLANDSVYGPFFNLREIFNDMNSRIYDLWGMSDSYEIAFHIQSYFLVLNKKTVNTRFFSSFWKKVYPLKNKDEIVIRYEIGLSQMALKENLKIGALLPYFRLINSIHENLILSKLINPTLYYWYEQIVHHNFPFLKSYLLKYNPAHLKNLHLIRDVLTTRGYDYNLVEQHLSDIVSENKRIK
jgi:lipopolysaccharide biosynthesis protein